MRPLGAWNLVPVAPNVATEPGLVLYRFGAALFYANAGRFLEEVSCVVQPMPSAVRWVVVDAEAMTHVDYTASRVVMQVKSNLTHAGIELAFARMPWDLRSDFDRHHLTETIGPARIFGQFMMRFPPSREWRVSREEQWVRRSWTARYQVDLFRG